MMNNYQTSKTRLVPIGEIQDKDDMYHVTEFGKIYYAFIDDVDKEWVCDPSGNGGGAYIEPTHFLQFKINGEWTHEFSIGKNIGN